MSDLTQWIFVLAIVLVLFYVLLVVASKKYRKYEDCLEEDGFSWKDGLLLIIGVLIMALLIVASISIFVDLRSDNDAAPETDVIATVETTESTTAPDETSVSETEETIHIEPSEQASQPSGGSVSGEVNIDVPQTDLELLACVIYQEAGADYICDDCRRRVADVVLNRVEDSGFPDTIYEVLTQKQQYGRFYWTGVVWPARANSAYEKHAVERAYRIAEEVLNGQHSELYGEGYIWQAEFTQGSGGFWCCGTYYGRG